MRPIFKYTFVTVATFGLLTALIQPIHSTKVNIAVLLLSVLLVCIALWSLRRIRWAFVSLCFILVFPTYPMLFNGPIDQKKLHSYYMTALRSYAGTTYAWGGEGVLGIDCSGLPRAAQLSANFKYAYIHFNGKALRTAVWLWWTDASAKELLNGYGSLTTTNQRVFKIRDLRSDVSPGDMAITKGGVHVMVYLSNQEIIQAEPERNRVVIDALPCENSWYDEDVKLVRWSEYSNL